MKKIINASILIIFIFNCTFSEVFTQNSNFLINFSLGIGNSGFNADDNNNDCIGNINYPMGGFQIQKRIKPRWAINIFPNIGMSGNQKTLDNFVGNITRIKSTSAFVNLSIHPKYYFNEMIYLSAGPEVSYLIWNYANTYNEDRRLSHVKETRFFNRTNLLISSSFGMSKKIGESRKNAPVQIDALWFLELRMKKGITNILNREYFSDQFSSSIFSIEIVTGISFASKG